MGEVSKVRAGEGCGGGEEGVGKLNIWKQHCCALVDLDFLFKIENQILNPA